MNSLTKSLIILAFAVPTAVTTGQDLSIEANSQHSLSLEYPATGIKKPSWPAATFQFNPLGFAMLGPVFQFEFNATGGMFIVPSLRYGYAGWVSHQTWTRSESDSKYSPLAIGLGVGIRQFFQVQKRGRAIYVGGFAEYSYDQARHNIDTDWESEQVHHGISVLANVGYRHWFRRSFFLQLGVYAGPSFDLKNESVYITGPEEGYIEKDSKGIWFVPLIDFALGWNLD